MMDLIGLHSNPKELDIYENLKNKRFLTNLINDIGVSESDIDALIQSKMEDGYVFTGRMISYEEAYDMLEMNGEIKDTPELKNWPEDIKEIVKNDDNLRNKVIFV